MNEFEQKMTEFWTDESPNTQSFFRLREGFQNISSEYKDQIHFIDDEGTKILNAWMYNSKMLSGIDLSRYDGKDWQPFNREYFNSIERFTVTEDCDKEIKKWLYNRGIPFSKYVFLDCGQSERWLMLTWKMVIKYWEEFFFAHDSIIVDSSFDWALFYFHESELYFGKDVKFDRKKEGLKTMELNKSIWDWRSKMKNV